MTAWTTGRGYLSLGEDFPAVRRVLAALMHSKDEMDTDVIDAVTSPMAAPDGGVPKKNERTSVNDA